MASRAGVLFISDSEVTVENLRVAPWQRTESVAVILPWHRGHHVEMMGKSKVFLTIQSMAPRSEACPVKESKHG